MKKLIPVLLAGALFSCTANTEKNDDKTPEKDAAKSQDTEMVKEDTYTVDLTMKPIDKKDLMKSISYQGEFVSAHSFQDKLGMNIIVLSANPETIEKVQEYDDRETHYGKVHAYQYTVANDKATLLWDMHDEERQCDFDLSIGFIFETPSVTDLDENDLAEVAVVYGKACRSDMSPAAMKLIMHQGEEKYALRGIMQDVLPDHNDTISLDDLDYSAKEQNKDAENYDYMDSFGRYQNANDFKKLDKRILDHAKQLWQSASMNDYKF